MQKQHTLSQRRLARYLWLLLGTVALILGTAGIVLPLLPTVPFYLLTVFCFAKGSTRMHDWFLRTTLYRKYLVPFLDKEGMTLRAKLYTLLTTAIVMGVSAYFLRDFPWGRRILAIVYLVQAIVLLCYVKTQREERR